MTNSLKFAKPAIRLDGKAQKPQDYTVLTFTRSVGGARVDQAVVRVERAPDKYLVNAESRPVEHEQVLEVLHAGKPVFWGVVEDSAYSFGQGPDYKSIVASVQPWLYGPPVTQAQYLVIRKRNGSQYADVQERIKADEPIVFNGFPPGREEWVTRNGLSFVGNKTLGRQYTALDRDGKPTKAQTPLLIPLEAVQTEVGRARYARTFVPYARLDSSGTIAGGAPSGGFEWTLQDAVRYVCALGNDEKFIANPSPAEFKSLPTFVLPPTKLPVGRHLPDLLDTLLTPYGWQWYVDPDGPQIRFVKWSQGPEVSAKYAKVHATADFDTTNIANVDNGYSTSQAVNAIHVKGGKVLVEGTWELYRVGQDKWVLNEGADYDQSTFPQYHTSAETALGVTTTDVIAPQPDELFPDHLWSKFLTSKFLQRMQRRRRFLPTLTLVGAVGVYGGNSTLIDTRPIGPNHGFDIEVLDFGQDDAAVGSEEWVNVDVFEDPMWRHIRVLDDECGIIFDRGREVDGDDPNSIAFNLFLASLSMARIRITATIEADFGIQAVVTRKIPQGASSVSKTEHTWVWHDEQRWPCRIVNRAGRYASKYADHTYTAETPNPDQILADMQIQARAILDRLDSAKIVGTLVFKGLDNHVPIGGIVKKIEGRELHMPTRHPKDSPQYPQIVAVHWDCQEASIVATLSSEPSSSLEAFA